MPSNEEFMRFLAAWSLVHETADEGWKAAVARGSQGEPGDMASGPEAFVDGLSAMIAEQKERLKRELMSGETTAVGSSAAVVEHLDELRFEVSELRGRIESLQSSIDALNSGSE